MASSSSSTGPIEAVVFDLGGVVLGSPLEGIIDYETANGIPLGFVNVNIVTRGHQGAFQRLERGEIKSFDEFYRDFKRELDDPKQLDAFANFKGVSRSTLPKSLDIDASALFRMMLERSMRADPDFVHAIYMLRGSKVKVGALTNNFAPMGSSAPGSINIHALEDLFDEIFESAVEGVRKPEPQAFKRTCDRLGVQTNRAVMMDDIGLNLKGAKGVGMETVLVKLKDKRQALRDLERILLERNGVKVSLVPGSVPVKLCWNVSTDNSKSKFVVGDTFGFGSNPPVVLIHGGGQTRHAWGATGRKLAEQGFFAVAVDLKGHGESYWDDVADYTSFSMAKDIDMLIKKMGFVNRSPLLVGASLGGLSVLSSEFAHSSKCGGVCLVDVTPKLEADGVDRILTFMKDGMEKGFDTLEDVAEAIRNYQPQRKRDPSTNIDSLRKNLVYNEQRKKWIFHWDPKFLDSWMERGTKPKDLDEFSRIVNEDASKIKAPVLLLKGKHTDIVSDDGVALLKAAVPHAQISTVKDAGHMVAGDQNDIFSMSLIAFANSIKPRMEKSSLALLGPNLNLQAASKI